MEEVEGKKREAKGKRDRVVVGGGEGICTWASDLGLLFSVRSINS